jgi:hypothetical protein
VLAKPEMFHVEIRVGAVMNIKKILSIAIVYVVSTASYAVDRFVPLPLPSEIIQNDISGIKIVATPDEVVSLIKANPLLAAKITSDAIKAHPSLAAEITDAAINAAPDSAPAITTAAVNAAVDAAKQAGTDATVAAVAVTNAAINAAMKIGVHSSTILAMKAAAVAAAPFAAAEISSAVNLMVYNNLISVAAPVTNTENPATTDIFQQQRKNVEEAVAQGLISPRQGLQLIALINMAQSGGNLSSQLSAN